MAFYHLLKKYQEIDPEKADRIARRLIKLRFSLYEKIEKNRTPNSLIIGSWNIRAFDDGKPRRDESYHYIAEIIDKFDICAVQEIKSDLAPLKRLMKLLGPNWDYFVTDVTGGSPGNSERMAFLYNTNRVRFRNLIGELVIPKKELQGGKQIARTPFFASFQASWFKFTLCSAHIIFGGTSVEEKALRAREVSIISAALAKRAKREDEVYVFMGDMNIETPQDKIMSSLTKNSFTAPLFGPTNLGGTKHFDQIAFTGEDIKTNLLNHGTFDWRDTVFTKDEADFYRPIAEKARGEKYKNWARSYSNWTSFEMSDHLPIWIELKVDYSDSYLARYLSE